MQNKGVITVFAILLALASLYQLSFTFVTWGIKSDAAEYAKGDFKKERAYLDSVEAKKAYPILGFTYSECEKREMNLGLDLKGGMNVILEVSVVDLIKNMSNNPNDSTFKAIIKLAREKQKSAQDDFVTLFYQAFKEITKDKAELAAFFQTEEMQDRINIGTPDDKVLEVLREEAKDAIDNSLNVLRSRIDRFGVVQPTIQKLDGNTGRILIELPGIKDPARVRKLLQGTADLQFWETYYFTDIYSYFTKADTKLKEILAYKKDNTSVKDTVEKDTTNSNDTIKVKDTTKKNELTELLANDSTKKPEDLLNLNKDSINSEIAKQKGFEEYKKEHPLFAVLNPNINRENMPIQSAAVGYAHLRDTAKVNELLNLKQIKNIFPRELSFSWEVKPFEIKGEPYFNLVALKSKKLGKPALSGDVVTNARERTDNTTGNWEITMSMNAVGASKWAKITKENINKQVAIVLDGYVYSFPVVNGEITGGSSSISGHFTHEEAKDLANILKSGKLKAPAKIIEDEVVGASLGQESINNSMISFAVAFIIVLIYMIFFYNSAGVVANIALITNLFFIFGVLASLGAVLTLPGIAGIVLTIGMSVDANVLIFERVKEEMQLGKGMKLAVSDGYKNAYSAIIDANITTLITGIVLYIFGHGPIKGFATTLIIGILTSLFAAIFITRLIFVARFEKNKSVKFFTKMTENAFKNTKILFIEKRKIAYVISGILIVVGLSSLFTKGLNLGVDFKGGRTYVVRFENDVNALEVAKGLKPQFESSPEVKIYGRSNQVKIVTKYMIESDAVNADSIVEAKLFTGVKQFLPKDTKKVDFLQKNLQASRKVGPTIADDIYFASILAIIFSLTAIFLYIFVRFRNWQFGLGALVALMHDVLIVMGIFSLLSGILPFSLEINQAFIAAILTVVGYSVNDTVVVFDRIREYLANTRTKERRVIYNEALNSTLSRTVSTSLSTFVVLLSIFLFGGESIRGFVFALLVGVVVGTYSSLFVATPVVFDTVKKESVKANEVKKNRDYRKKNKNA